MEQKLLEITRNQAITVKRLLADDTAKDDFPAGRRLSIKTIDAILTMEDEDSDSFPLWLNEAEFWLLNSLIFEESKDMFGASMRPLLRDIWRRLREYHEDELISSPALELCDTAAEAEARERLEVWKATSASSGSDNGLSEVGG
jgi:hypothetical protein